MHRRRPRRRDERVVAHRRRASGSRLRYGSGRLYRSSRPARRCRRQRRRSQPLRSRRRARHDGRLALSHRPRPIGVDRALSRRDERRALEAIHGRSIPHPLTPGRPRAGRQAEIQAPIPALDGPVGEAKEAATQQLAWRRRKQETSKKLLPQGRQTESAGIDPWRSVGLPSRSVCFRWEMSGDWPTKSADIVAPSRDVAPTSRHFAATYPEPPPPESSQSPPASSGSPHSRHLVVSPA